MYKEGGYMRFIHRLIHMFFALLAQFPSPKGEIFVQGSRGYTVAFFPHPNPLPEGEGFWFRRPFFKKINVGVGSKPTLLCNHARKGIHKVRSQPFFPNTQRAQLHFSLTLPSPQGRGFLVSASSPVLV